MKALVIALFLLPNLAFSSTKIAICRTYAPDVLYTIACDVPNAGKVLQGGVQVGAEDQYFVIEGQTSDAFASCEYVK